MLVPISSKCGPTGPPRKYPTHWGGGSAWATPPMAHAHKPLIRFLGPRLPGGSLAAPATGPAAQSPARSQAPPVLEPTRHPWQGRRSLPSEAEIQCVLVLPAIARADAIFSLAACWTREPRARVRSEAAARLADPAIALLGAPPLANKCHPQRPSTMTGKNGQMFVNLERGTPPSTDPVASPSEQPHCCLIVKARRGISILCIVKAFRALFGRMIMRFGLFSVPWESGQSSMKLELYETRAISKQEDHNAA